CICQSRNFSVFNRKLYTSYSFLIFSINNLPFNFYMIRFFLLRKRRKNSCEKKNINKNKKFKKCFSPRKFRSFHRQRFYLLKLNILLIILNFCNFFFNII